MILDNKPFVVASRGRNPDNPSDRTKGIKTEQRLEPNKQGLCNTLTSVQKDNYVVEPPHHLLMLHLMNKIDIYAQMGQLARL